MRERIYHNKQKFNNDFALLKQSVTLRSLSKRAVSFNPASLRAHFLIRFVNKGSKAHFDQGVSCEN